MRIATLAAVAVVLLAGRVSSSAKARSTEQRLNDLIQAAAPAISLVANGGTIGGDITVNGKITGTANINTSGNVNCGAITASNTIYPQGAPGLSMGGNIAMNGYNAYGGGTYT